MVNGAQHRLALFTVRARIAVPAHTCEGARNGANDGPMYRIASHTIRRSSRLKPVCDRRNAAATVSPISGCNFNLLALEAGP